jgi:hypothetical protein
MESRIMTLSLSTMMSGGGAQSDNNFTVMTEGNGYTLVDLTTTYPAGKYSVASKLLDTTYDIYLIAEDGSNAGYLAASSYIQLNITATQAFNKVVIYGATNNDVINFTYSNIYSATGPSTGEFTGAAPRLISISTSDLPNQNNTTTITGQNFATDVQVTFTGTDSVARSAKAINRVSSTSLIVTRPDDMPTTYSPYTLTATNPGITAPASTNTHKLTNAITAGNAPIWVTGATLPAYRKSEAYSQTVQATDADGGSSITYSVVSGSLPDGITFNTSTATFSGTATTNAASPYTYTIRATDAGANYVDRAFTVRQLAPDAVTIGTATDVGTSRAFNNGAATVTFTPAATGPAATSYTVTSSPGGYTGSGSSSPITVTGLQSNTAYTFTVVASNASGNSLTSSATSSITATTVPQAPTVGTVSVSGTTASVPFTANATGGKTISNYDVTSSPLGYNYTGGSSPISATSLAYGNTYTFQVRAFNANGWSAYSSSSNGVSVSYPSSDSDSFNRTTSVALGNTTSSGQSWANLIGTWFANGSQAQSNDGTAAAIIRMIGSHGTVQAGTVSPGVGLVYWAADSGNLIASYPYYTTSTSQQCNGFAYCGGTSCTPSGCCGAVQGPTCERECSCGGGSCYAYSNSGTTTCVSCSTSCSEQCGMSGTAVYTFTYRYCTAYQSVTANRTYVRTTRYSGGSSSVVDDYLLHDTSSTPNPINSMRVTTASNGVSNIYTWTSTGFGGTQLTTRSISPGPSSYGTGYGLFKTAYGNYYSQGSVADDFATSGF